MIELSFQTPSGAVTVRPRAVVVAGWTGRNEAAVTHHIEELAAIGVARPSTVPLFYRVAVQQLAQTGSIEAVGAGTSGEVEPVLVRIGDRTLLTVGSDHTDRALEAVSVALSKQIAAKPIARDGIWLDEIADVDALTLEASISNDGVAFEPYQSGTVAMIRPLATLLEGAAAAGGGLADGLVVFCGTVPTLSGKIVPARHFSASICDPVTDRTLGVAYRIDELPVVA